MTTIFKYHLQVNDTVKIEMYKGAQILTAQKQGIALWLWAMVDTSQPIEQRVLSVFGTGNPMPKTLDVSDWIASVQDGDFVWHIFEFCK